MRTVWSNKCLGSIEAMGSSFPHPPADFILHSIYSGTLNFTDSHQKNIFSLLTNRDSIHPHAAILRTSQNQRFQLSDLDLKVGQHLNFTDSAIIFDCGLWVSFVGAKRTHPNDEAPPGNILVNNEKITLCTMFLNTLQIAAKTELQWKCLLQETPNETPFISQFRNKVHALEKSFFENNLDDAIEHGLSLVGFGPGLTPTGDDFLYGYSLAAYVRSNLDKSDYNHIDVEFTNKWLQGILEKNTNTKKITTDISYMFLQLAQEQKYSQLLLSLAHSFCQSQATNFDNCLEAIRTLGLYGHSSGYDTATGFLFGLGGKDRN